MHAKHFFCPLKVDILIRLSEMDLPGPIQAANTGSAPGSAV